MNVSETAVVTVIASVLTGLGGGGGLVAFMKMKKEAPVTQKEAEISYAEKSQQMALAVAKAAQADNARLRKEMSGYRDDLAGLGARVESLEKDNRDQARTIRILRDTVRILSAWADDIVSRWSVIRLETDPPRLPNLPRVDKH